MTPREAMKEIVQRLSEVDLEATGRIGLIPILEDIVLKIDKLEDEQ